jgi:hypothetical protein
MNNIKIKQCLLCGRDFPAYPPSREDNLKFCTALCANKYNADHRTTKKQSKVCKNCGREFTTWESRTTKFCNKKCYGDWMRKTTMIVCEYCGIEFHRRHSELSAKHHYCSRNCFALARLKKLPRNRHTKGLRNMLLKRDKLIKCCKCGFNVPAILVVHHKDGDRRNNNLSNLQILCPNCHSLLHYTTNSGIYSKNEHPHV